jgi:hypothetical protein
MTNIWLLIYEGQTQSPYMRQASSLLEAMAALKTLEKQYPERRWHIEEKDVS